MTPSDALFLFGFFLEGSFYYGEGCLLHYSVAFGGGVDTVVGVGGVDGSLLAVDHRGEVVDESVAVFLGIFFNAGVE